MLNLSNKSLTSIFYSIGSAFIVTVILLKLKKLYVTYKSSIQDYDNDEPVKTRLKYFTNKKLFVINNCFNYVKRIQIEKYFHLFKFKSSKLCELRFESYLMNAKILVVNDYETIKHIYEINSKLNNKLLESQLQQMFLVQNSDLKTKLNLFEWEFFIKRLFNRNFNSIKSIYMNKIFKKKFQELLIRGDKLSILDEKQLNKFIEMSIIEYIKFYYKKFDDEDDAALFDKLVSLSQKLNTRLTLSLLLNSTIKPDVEQSRCERLKLLKLQIEYRILYKQFLELIETLLEKHKNSDSSSNSFVLKCLYVRYLLLNIRFIQVLFKQVLIDLIRLIKTPENVTTELINEINSIKKTSGNFIGSEMHYKFKHLNKLVNNSFIKCLKFDVLKLDKKIFNETRIEKVMEFLLKPCFKSVNETINCDEDEDLYLVINLIGLKNEQLNELASINAIVSHQNDDFILVFLTSLILNLLKSIDIDKVQLTRIEFEDNIIMDMNYLKYFDYEFRID